MAIEASMPKLGRDSIRNQTSVAPVSGDACKLIDAAGTRTMKLSSIFLCLPSSIISLMNSFMFHFVLRMRVRDNTPDIRLIHHEGSAMSDLLFI